MRLSDVLSKAKAEDLTMVCFYDDPGEADYTGKSVREAKEALTACDVMHLSVIDAHQKQLGWFMIVNEFGGDPDEQVADCTITDWTRKHWPELEF